MPIFIYAPRETPPLTALGTVITSLVSNAHGGKKAHINYRDSKLTMILRDSLRGMAKTCIIANVAASRLGSTLASAASSAGHSRLTGRASLTLAGRRPTRPRRRWAPT